jgi:hypothetical protein
MRQKQPTCIARGEVGQGGGWRRGRGGGGGGGGEGGGGGGGGGWRGRRQTAWDSPFVAS